MPETVGQILKRRQVSAGYLMIECLVYLTLLTVITGFGFTAFYHCMMNSRHLTRNADAIVRALKAGERWRADIRHAVDKPRLIETEEGVVFEIPQRGESVVYTFSGNCVWRKEGDGRPTKVIPGVGMSEMVEEVREHVTVWRWDLELDRPAQALRLRPIFTFRAVAIEAEDHFTKEVP